MGFVLFPQFQILDLTGPVAVFEDPPGAPAAYRSRLLSEGGGLVVSSSGVAVMTERWSSPVFDTLVVVGGAGTFEATESAAMRDFIRAAAAHSRRVASICAGADILAGAGLLDDRQATTHWRFAQSFQRRYPRVRVDSERIFIQDGPIWTSAGVSAGIDLSLALVEQDLGLEESRERARNLVVYHRRPGGQSQFSSLLEMEPASDRIREVLTFAREHLHEPLDVERLARVACLSARQFAREFLAQTGQTPAKAIERLRVEVARTRLEEGSESIEQVAEVAGFGDAERMRRAFVRVFGQPPQALRRLGRGDRRGIGAG
ncbi:MAG: GlxA family transcriptional regulator [Cystobacter sp.]